MARPSIDHGILSPSGRVSKRATSELFAPWGGHLPRPGLPPQPSEKNYCCSRRLDCAI